MSRSARKKAQSVSDEWLQKLGWLDWNDDSFKEKHGHIKDEWNLRCLARFIDWKDEITGYSPYQPSEYASKCSAFNLENEVQREHALQAAKKRLGKVVIEKPQYKSMMKGMGITATELTQWRS